MRVKKHNILELQKLRKEWREPNSSLWSEEQKKQYFNRKKAVDMYIDDCSVAEIHAMTGIPHSKLSKLIERCLQLAPGTALSRGYEALVPHKKICKNALNAINPLDNRRGAFKKLLLLYPTLESFIYDNYFRTNKTVLEKNVSPAILHRKFLEKCRALNIQDYEYPFNTNDKARRSFYKYLDQIAKENINLALKRQNQNAQQKLSSTGTGKRMRPYPLAPFSVVQLDGHKIDMLYSVEVLNKHGEVIHMPATRMWLIAVIDVSTRAIIGYSLTGNENYNQTDVLRAIRNSILPKVPMKFTLPGLQYPVGYGFPSLAIPEAEWAMPGTIMLDNAKAHLAENVVTKLCDNLFCSLNFGSVATPETRGIIERVFKTLEDNGYHRIVSTTGSNINDIKRANAEKDSVTYQITYDDIVQLTEYFIALYNTSAHSALDNQTPLECMQRRIRDAGMQPCISNPNMRLNVYELTNFTEHKTVRGSVSAGKRPYITYKGVEYRNEILSQSMGLIGSKLIIEVNPDDISTLKGYFEDGTELGVLTATGEWGRRSHSLKTREEVLKFSRNNKKRNSPFFAPLTEFENELISRSQKERRSRTKVSRIRAEQKKKSVQQLEDRDLPDNIIPIRTGTVSKRRSTPTTENSKDKRLDNYSQEELEAILNAGSLEDAFNKGLI